MFRAFSPTIRIVPNKLRIIGGEWRSRIITFPDEQGLRPTTDRVRETLFNWLGQTLEGKTCLDLFGGSGALGFEAHSRGARGVTMIERHPKVFTALRENAAKLQATRMTLVQDDALAWLGRTRDVYDVIFLDPPFQSGLLEKLLPLLSTHLSAEGVAYIESGTPLIAPDGMQLIRDSRAGQVYFGLVQKAEHA